jgi:hypothetical protein
MASRFPPFVAVPFLEHFEASISIFSATFSIFYCISKLINFGIICKYNRNDKMTRWRSRHLAFEHSKLNALQWRRHEKTWKGRHFDHIYNNNILLHNNRFNDSNWLIKIRKSFKFMNLSLMLDNRWGTYDNLRVIFNFIRNPFSILGFYPQFSNRGLRQTPIQFSRSNHSVHSRARGPSDLRSKIEEGLIISPIKNWEWNQDWMGISDKIERQPESCHKYLNYYRTLQHFWDNFVGESLFHT